MSLMFSLLDDDPLPWYGPISAAAKERFIVLGAMTLVVLAVFIWVAFVREKPRRRSSRVHRHRRSVIKSTMEGMAEVKRVLRTREHRRRQEHRPRNPTLAETGGLPPTRSDGAPTGPAANEA